MSGLLSLVEDEADLTPGLIRPDGSVFNLFSWKLRRGEFPPAPDLVQAVAGAAERLALTAA